MRPKERCCRCDEETGRAGEYDDSIYVNGLGPYCEICEPDALREFLATVEQERDELAEKIADLGFLAKVAPMFAYRPDAMAAEIVRLRAEVDQLRERNSTLWVVLKDLEWSSYELGECPCCGNDTPDDVPEKSDHAANCALAAALYGEEGR